MNKIFFFLLALFIWNTASVDAQVAIGDLTNIHDGAVLDLKTTGSHGGLLLPHVELTDAHTWNPLGDAQSDAVNGMVVYNTSSSIFNDLSGKGVYIWDTNRWKLISTTDIGTTPVTNINISGDNRINIGQSSTLTASALPVNATNKGIAWSASPSGVVELSNGGPNGVTVKALKSDNVTIIATAMDGSFVFGTFKILVIGTFTCGSNGIPGSVTALSGDQYKTYTYNTSTDGTAECWMVENSHEGYYDAGSGSYNGDPTMSNGAYYKWEQAMETDDKSPCPPGWSLPTKAQLDKLATIVNADQTGSGKWWTGSQGTVNNAFAGGNLSNQSSWTNYRWQDYDMVGYWWASTNFIVNGGGDFLFSNSTSNSAVTNKSASYPLASYNQYSYLSVRCVKQP